MKEPLKRRLAAILFADIAGYTALMQSDEPLARHHLRVFKESISTLTAKHAGEVINFYGDGCVCVYESSVNALECAKAIQLDFISQEVPVRIGLHSGDVYFEDDNVFGDGVNIASRIESIAVPGAVLFSARMEKDARNQPSLSHTLLGHFDLKNVTEPVTVYALDTPPLVVPSEVGSTAKLKEPANKPKTLTFGLREAMFLVALTAVLLVTTKWNTITSLFSEGSSANDKNTVAILEFKNSSGDPDFDLVAKMVTDRIVHGVTSNDIARVITSDVVEDYQRIMTSSLVPTTRNEFLNEEMAVDEVIEGSIYVRGEELIVESTVTNAATGEVIKGLPTVTGPAADPMTVVDEARQEVLGYLAAAYKRDLDLMLDDNAPRFDAYREFSLAELAETRGDDSTFYLHLRKAIELDPDYFEPRVNEIAYYYNLDDYDIADSLLQSIKAEQKFNDPRQINLILFYEALMNGSNNLMYKYLKQEYDLAPFHLSTSQSLMVIGIQYNNLIDQGLDIYNDIPEDKLDFASCNTCRIRMFLKLYVLIEQGQLRKAVKDGEKLIANNGEDWGTEMLIRAYVRSEEWGKLNELLTKLGDNTDMHKPADLYTRATIEAHNAGYFKEAVELGEEVLSLSIGAKDELRGQVLLIAGDTTGAYQSFQVAHANDSTNRNVISYLAGLELVQGNQQAALDYMQLIHDLQAKHDYGQTEYWFARAFAIARDYDESMKYLKNSVANGYWNNAYHFQNDIVFQSVKDTREFNEIRDYWKTQ